MSSDDARKAVSIKLDKLNKSEISKLKEYAGLSDNSFYVLATTKHNFNRNDMDILKELLKELPSKINIVNDKINELSANDVDILIKSLKDGYSNMCATSKDFGFTTDDDPILRKILNERETTFIVEAPTDEAPQAPSKYSNNILEDESKSDTKSSTQSNTQSNIVLEIGSCNENSNLRRNTDSKRCCVMLSPAIENADCNTYLDYICLCSKCVRNDMFKKMPKCVMKNYGRICGCIIIPILAIILLIFLIFAYILDAFMVLLSLIFVPFIVFTLMCGFGCCCCPTCIVSLGLDDDSCMDSITGSIFEDDHQDKMEEIDCSSTCECCKEFKKCCLELLCCFEILCESNVHFNCDCCDCGDCCDCCDCGDCGDCCDCCECCDGCV